MLEPSEKLRGHPERLQELGGFFFPLKYSSLINQVFSNGIDCRENPGRVLVVLQTVALHASGLIQGYLISLPTLPFPLQVSLAIETLALFIILASFVLHDIFTLGISMYVCMYICLYVLLTLYVLRTVQPICIVHKNVDGYFFQRTNLRRNQESCDKKASLLSTRLSSTFKRRRPVDRIHICQFEWTVHSLRTCSLVS